MADLILSETMNLRAKCADCGRTDDDPLFTGFSGSLNHLFGEQKMEYNYVICDSCAIAKACLCLSCLIDKNKDVGVADALWKMGARIYETQGIKSP